MIPETNKQRICIVNVIMTYEYICECEIPYYPIRIIARTCEFPGFVIRYYVSLSFYFFLMYI